MARPVFLSALAVVVVLVVGALAATSVLAADPLTDAMQDAYAPYRAALFKTNSAAQTESQLALQQAQASWARLAAAFGAKPPAPYDRDAGFAATLTEVAAVYDKAAEQVAANQLASAHATLEQVRDIVADLRRRNQVIVFSDHMNAYHTEMEHILKEGAKLLGQPDGMARLTALAGALSYLAARLSLEAPARYAANEEFQTLVKAVQQSVDELQTALFARDAAAATAALQRLKAPYGRLFLKFG